MISTPENRIFEFCNGDLTLLKGSNLGPDWHFVVSRDTLSKTSPVFDDLLRTTYTSREVTLDDDDPYVWLIILNIIYNRPEKMPAVMSGDTLVLLATLCDKYDLAHICRDYIDEWLIQIEPSEALLDTSDRLWIYWVFGYPQNAKQMMALAINSVTRDKEARWITSEPGKPVEDRPPGLLGMFNFKKSFLLEARLTIPT